MQNSTLGARDVSAFHNSQVSAFPSGRTHQNIHKIEGTVISCPHFRGVHFSHVSARTGSSVFKSLYVSVYTVLLVIFARDYFSQVVEHDYAKLKLKKIVS